MCVSVLICINKKQTTNIIFVFLFFCRLTVYFIKRTLLVLLRLGFFSLRLLVDNMLCRFFSYVIFLFSFVSVRNNNLSNRCLLLYIRIILSGGKQKYIYTFCWHLFSLNKRKNIFSVENFNQKNEIKKYFRF